MMPLVEELPGTLSAPELFRRLSAARHCVYFDSADPAGGLGRCSYLAVDPYQWLTVPVDGTDGLRQLEEVMPSTDACCTIEGLPPFQGGAAGLLSYDLGRSLECVPTPRFDEFSSPAMAVGLYDVVLAFDHTADRGWIISTGLPESQPESQRARAAMRLEWMKRLIESPPPPQQRQIKRQPLSAPQREVEGLAGVTSDFSRDEYLAAVARAVEYIHAGDIFQVNLSQRLVREQQAPPEELYLQLRERNPAPFAGYADLGELQICSASPERFLTVRNGCVETRPIKGTRPRSADAARDAELAAELVEHPKDRAENVMIVDLLRNDLSRVCTPSSVHVPVLCGLESYRHVHHLVSVVEGDLAPGRTAIDLLRASFPGGSITGAPKVRAMEIIAELAPTARGPYCGSLFWAGFNGAMDSSILIRTAICGGGWVQTPVGGGIVADSDPATEYEETLHKAKGMLGTMNDNR